MNALEKTEKYLREHKKPVSVDTIACHYMVRTSTIQKALNELKAQNLAISERIRKPDGKTFFSVWRYNQRSLAVPRQIDQTPRHPNFESSYPNIRGYED